MARELAAWARREGVAALLLAAGLLAVALREDGAIEGADVGLAVAALYAALALACVQAAVLAARVGVPGALLAGSGLAALLCWHLREQTDLLHFGARGGVALAAFAALALAFAYAVRRVAPRRGPAVAVLGLAGSLAATAIAAFALPRFWPELHDHLYSRHRMLAAGVHRIAGDPAPSLPALFEELGIPRRSRPGPAPHVGGSPEADAVSVRNASSPDLVLVVVDTLRADALADYGGDPEWMPHLNAMAARAAVFSDVTANAPWTSPSVASLLTGLLPEQHGLLELGDRLAPDNRTLAEVLAGEGYETAAFVANAAVDGSLGFDQGFQVYRELRCDGAYVRADGVREAALGWLDARRDTSAPLFLYLHFMDPHTPYESGDAPRFWQPEHHRPAYLRELAFLDTELARLLPALRGRLGADTVVLLTSDHGEAFGEHGGYGHGHALYRELLRIPAILGTGTGRGEHIGAPLEARDFFHLLAERARGGASSLASWAASRRRSVRYASSYATPRSWRALGFLRPYATRRLRGVERAGRTLLWSDFGDRLELYDLVRDPEQRRDLARARPEWVRALQQQLQERPAYAVLPDGGTLSAELAARLQALGYVE